MSPPFAPASLSQPAQGRNPPLAILARRRAAAILSVLSSPVTENCTMALREAFTEQLKAAMKAGDTARTSTLRMVLARLKDVDIAARPKGIDRVSEDEILTMLRGMVKSRRESIELYRQGRREDLATKEEREIAVIESFLPAQMDEAATLKAIEAAIAETGASSIKEMGKVMAALRGKHAATIDLAAAGPMVKARLAP
jgi:uncharacterized protein